MTYAALTGILVVTFAYATVGLLLALRPGGGRMGAILLVGSVASPRCHSGTCSLAAWRSGIPLDPVANVLVLLWVRRSSRSGTP